MSNKMLGDYDMVLSLSIDKINSQFEFIYDKLLFLGKERAKKGERVGFPFWEFMVVDDKIVHTKKEKWEEYEDALKELSNLERKKEDIHKKLKKEKSTLKSDEKKALKIEVFDLDEQCLEYNEKIESFPKFDTAIKAKIKKAPSVELIKKSDETSLEKYKNLFFKVEFEEGTLFSNKKGGICQYDLSNVVYTFKVGISKVKLESKSDHEIFNVIDHEEILDSDFTVDALFINFQDSNISEYDDDRSSFPNDLHIPEMQTTFTNYLKSLKKSENPHIFGFTKKLKKNNNPEKALLSPTGVSYSVSPKNNTFNFMMLLDGRGFPTNFNSSIINESLFSKRKDTSETINGIFAIDLEKFKKDCISPLILSKIKNELNKKFNNLSKEKRIGEKYFFDNAYEKVDISSIEGDDFDFYVSLYKKIYEKDRKNETFIKLKDGKINFKTEVLSKSDGISILINISVPLSKIEFSQYGSISDKEGHAYYSSSEGGGQEGSLSINIKPGANGKLIVSTEVKELKVGLGNAYIDKIGISISDLLSFLPGAFMPLLSGISFDSEIIKKEFLDNIDVKLSNNLMNIDNKIVFPGASTYTYKNIQKVNDTIICDIAYAETE